MTPSRTRALTTLTPVINKFAARAPSTHSHKLVAALSPSLSREWLVFFFLFFSRTCAKKITRCLRSPSPPCHRRRACDTRRRRCVGRTRTSADAQRLVMMTRFFPSCFVACAPVMADGQGGARKKKQKVLLLLRSGGGVTVRVVVFFSLFAKKCDDESRPSCRCFPGASRGSVGWTLSGRDFYPFLNFVCGCGQKK